MLVMTLQKALSDYIEFKKDNKRFTKYLEELNGRTDKNNSKENPRKK